MHLVIGRRLPFAVEALDRTTMSVKVRRSSWLCEVKIDASDEKVLRNSGKGRSYCGSYEVELAEDRLADRP
ncbi:hypothetical protein JCM24511_08089 [Saitozyma sp. JCM 24511]|nr:hypothetical protein JCM24511_08089 [Saitozyma sp. JCM 24511]